MRALLWKKWAKALAAHDTTLRTTHFGEFEPHHTRNCE
jgi:hypothetical protein